MLIGWVTIIHFPVYGGIFNNKKLAKFKGDGKKEIRAQATKLRLTIKIFGYICAMSIEYR